jgi:2-haloacid dehalogenase
MELQAIAFDVFGTVVDWRSGVAASATAHGLPGERFADAWRARYVPSMDLVRRGELPWMNLDALHRRSLDELLVEFGSDDLDEAARQDLVLAWHRLPPWPDSVAGLERLRSRFIVTTLSNGGFALLTHLARSAGLRFDCILSAELCRHYKPDPQTYLMVPTLLALQPSEVMLVAAHKSDLRAARGAGLRTGFLERPREQPGADRRPAPEADVEAGDLLELAELLEAGPPT